MKSLKYLFLAINIFIVFALHCSPVSAASVAGEQISSGEKTSQNSAATDTRSGQDAEPGDILSNAEQLLKIEAGIEADQNRIKELQTELAEEEKSFNNLSSKLKKLVAQKDGKEQQLSSLADKTSSAAQALQLEIDNASRDYELFKQQLDVNLQSQKTLKAQVRGLEEKIANDEKLLEALRGDKKPEPVTQPQTSQPSAAGAAQDTTPALRTPIPLPSEPTPDAAPQQQEIEALATPEQIEAQKEEQEKRAEAKQAEQIVVEFVERKKSLEDQIIREQELLNNQIESRSNIETYLATLDEKQSIADEKGEQKEVTRLQQEKVQALQKLRKLQQEIVSRSMLLNQLHQQLSDVQGQQLQAVKMAEEKRQQAEEARQKNVWLQSPLHPHNIAQWVMTRGPRVLLVIVFMILLLFISRVSVKRVAKAVSGKGRGSLEGRANRAETIALSMDAVLRLLIYVGGTFLVLEEAGVDIKTILGGAAIIGLAFAFGAQNLMRDYFSGIMILLEDQYELGDVVTVGNVTGVVERVNMRATVLRDLEGRVHFIPNGEIKQVTNRTYEWAQAVFDINVSYKENVDEVMTLLMDLAREIQKEPEYRDDILSDPVMLGVDKFGDAAVTIKFVLKTRGNRMWPVKRELLRRIKNKFDEVGIQIPVPQREVVQHAPA